MTIMIRIQRHKACFLALILIFTIAGSAFGSFDARSGISGYVGGAFCHPTAEYLATYPGDSSVAMPTFRTSGNVAMDFQALQLRFGLGSGEQNKAFFVELGISYVGVGRSLAFGVSVLRPYDAYGGYIELGGVFNDFFSLGVLFRVMSGRFPSVNQVFRMYEFEVAPTFELATFRWSSLSLVVPITASIKKDAVTLRLTCGLKLDFSWSKLFTKKGAQR